ncbi:putative metal-binding motif-containing protein [Thermodesulfobacteriota bacterium]
MKVLLRIVMVYAVCFLGSAAFADAPLITCAGTGCGGTGPAVYAYDIDSASYPMMDFRVGTNDLNPENYTNVLIPPGWSFAVEENPMSHAHGVHTPHGEVSPGPCWCLTAGSVHWWTDDPALTIEFFIFGYDHPWTSEDVGWDLSTRREGPPPEEYAFHQFWDALVGVGTGPVHGPYALEECPDWDQDGYQADGCGGDDCDDLNPWIHPGATELCNGVDDDCDGEAPGEVDGDGDDFLICTGDCDDDPSNDPPICDTCTCGTSECGSCARCINPGAEEIPGDGIDNDCDGVTCPGMCFIRRVM